MTSRLGGWKRQKPDKRDHTLKMYGLHAELPALPAIVDLRPKCSPIVDQGSLGSCHDANTEVLTESGWCLFSDLTGDECLASVNPLTSELIYEKPTRIIRFPFKGELIVGHNYHTLDFRVTPEHKMLVRKWDENKRTLSDSYVFIEAQKLGWYTGLMNRVTWKGDTTNSNIYVLPGIPDHKHKPQREPKTLPMSIWLQFLGIYLAEGSMCKDIGHYKIQIAAFKEREKRCVRKLLCDLGVNALELPDRFTFDNRQIYEEMVKLGLFGVHAPQKFVPEFVFKQNAENIRAFLHGHFMGDGCESGNRTHYTSSASLADDLQRLIFLSGDESHISIRPPRSSTMLDGRIVIGRYPERRVSVCETKNLSIDRSNDIKKETYDGNVFCAEVPTYHTLVTRRNYRILISGNCTANAGAGLVDYCEKKQGHPFLTGSRLLLYYNTRVRVEGEPADEDTGCTIRDTLASLAKYGICKEVTWPYDIAKFSKKPSTAANKEALNYKALSYALVDQPALTPAAILTSVKTQLSNGIPMEFGFDVYDSYSQANTTGAFPYPSKHESIAGGHAVCFTKDTKISLLDGRELNFDEIEKEFSNSPFWVYSYDDTVGPVPGKATFLGKTGIKEKILKIALDNGNVIRCTENHSFLMRSGLYRQARDLVPGDSLMPLYRKLSDKDSHISGYEMIYNNQTNAWGYTHRIVRKLTQPYNKDAPVTHHKDFNKLNNCPSNLEAMSWDDHTELHSRCTDLLVKYAKSDIGREKSRELMNSLWNNPEWKKESLERIRINGINVSHKLLEEGRLGFQAMDPEILRELTRENGKKAAYNNFKTPEAIEKSIKTRRLKMKTDPEYAERARRRAVENIQGYNKDLNEGLISLTDKQISARRQNAMRLNFNRWHKNDYDSFEEYLTETNQSQKYYNHKVLSIEEDGYEDVYDISVENYHNFALTAGVFVHNCAVGYDDSKVVTNTINKSKTTGALLIRNSWGTGWGQSGYGWLPYAYITTPFNGVRLAADFWTLISAGWKLERESEIVLEE